MTRTGDQACAWARAQHDADSRVWRGLCLAFTRSCFDVAPYYPRAIDAWDGAQHKHRVTSGSQVPRGVPVFWDRDAGHIALSTGNGFCWSSDIFVSGGVSLARIDYISQAWGKNLLGWSEDVNTVTVWHSPPPAVKLTVSLSDVVKASRQDPTRPQGHTTPGAYHSALRTERMLAVEGLLAWSFVDGSFGSRTREAYAHWQRLEGFTGGQANGTPGISSLTALCRRHNMEVTE